jgi:hypothetical protein
MIENDDGGCKAGLSRLAEFPWSKKPTDESANRGGSAGGYLPGSPPEFLINYAYLARIVLARDSRGAAASGRPMFRNSNA